jgi:hypothetical protein
MWNFKTLKIQKSFTTYKWGIMYMMCEKKLYFILQEDIKKFKTNF